MWVLQNFVIELTSVLPVYRTISLRVAVPTPLVFPQGVGTATRRLPNHS